MDVGHRGRSRRACGCVVRDDGRGPPGREPRAARARGAHGPGRHARADQRARRQRAVRRRDRRRGLARGAGAGRRRRRAHERARASGCSSPTTTRSCAPASATCSRASRGSTVVGEASNGAEALALALELRAGRGGARHLDAGRSGLQTAAELRRRCPETRILILSMHDNTEYVLESLRAGVHGYLLKDSAAAELRGAIRAVCRRRVVLQPADRQPARRRASRGELGEPRRTPRPAHRPGAPGAGRASPAGRTNKEIAAGARESATAPSRPIARA